MLRSHDVARRQPVRSADQVINPPVRTHSAMRLAHHAFIPHPVVDQGNMPPRSRCNWKQQNVIRSDVFQPVHRAAPCRVSIRRGPRTRHRIVIAAAHAHIVPLEIVPNKSTTIQANKTREELLDRRPLGSQMPASHRGRQCVFDFHRRPAAIQRMRDVLLIDPLLRKQNCPFRGNINVTVCVPVAPQRLVQPPNDLFFFAHLRRRPVIASRLIMIHSERPDRIPGQRTDIKGLIPVQ